MFSTDITVAMLAFIFILLIMAWVWDYSREKMILTDKRINLNLISDFASSALVESQGSPSSWNLVRTDKFNESYVSSIGLASDSPLNLSISKIQKLREVDNYDYETVKKILGMRGPGYEYFLRLEKPTPFTITGFFDGNKIAYTNANGLRFEGEDSKYGIRSFLENNNVTFTDYEDDWPALLDDIRAYDVIVFEDPKLSESDLSADQTSNLLNWVSEGGVYVQKQYGQIIEVFNVTTTNITMENGTVVNTDIMLKNTNQNDTIRFEQGYRLSNQSKFNVMVDHISGSMLIGYFDYGKGRIYYIPDTEATVYNQTGGVKYTDIRFILNLPQQKDLLNLGFYPQTDAASIVINKRMALVENQYTNVTLMLWERADALGQGYCEVGEYLIVGDDMTVACCQNPTASVVDSICVNCPEDKPNFVYSSSFVTGESELQILLQGSEQPYSSSEASILLPCQSQIVKADIDVYNDQQYLENETSSDPTSAVILTDVSGSMNWRFNSNSWGTDRSCTDDLIFENTTQRISLARCLQNGINNSQTEFDGVIHALLNNSPQNLVGLSMFETNGAVVSFLTNDEDSLKTLVSGYTAGGATNIQSGLEVSVIILENGNPNEDNSIVLISDGSENYGDADEFVCNGSFPRDQIVVYPLGIGPSYQFTPGFKGDCDYAGDPSACETLLNIANCSGGTAYNAMDPAGAANMLDQIVGQILEPEYPSTINILNLQYNTTLNGTQDNPVYLDPKPDIYQTAQNASDSCTMSPYEFDISISSSSQGYLTLNNLEVAACTP
ncbi:MAG: hypothetical protein MAG795_00625 [Candidatus Woesearchaeota archaeon]|nr:hypothetical protein [Candidatus Woesearchaeota archaeon]